MFKTAVQFSDNFEFKRSLNHQIIRYKHNYDRVVFESEKEIDYVSLIAFLNISGKNIEYKISKKSIHGNFYLVTITFYKNKQFTFSKQIFFTESLNLYEKEILNVNSVKALVILRDKVKIIKQKITEFNFVDELIKFKEYQENYIENIYRNERDQKIKENKLDHKDDLLLIDQIKNALFMYKKEELNKFSDSIHFGTHIVKYV